MTRYELPVPDTTKPAADFEQERTGVSASIVFGFLCVLGVFNRITFPAYLLVPGLQLVPHFRRKPFSLLFILLSAAATTLLAVGLDTAFYKHTGPLDFSDLWRRPVLTPLNNFLYNSDSVNLAKHGLHPFYQHIVANLPQLLGPAFPLLLLSYRRTMRLAAGLSGILILSIFPHQEARFLLPAIPLILSSIRLPVSIPRRRIWIASWIAFNLLLGVLMGRYHQGGVVPAQMHIATVNENVGQVFWWKTYSPPVWLLNGKNENLTTIDLMGIKPEKMMELVRNGTACKESKAPETWLVAPKSAHYLKKLVPALPHKLTQKLTNSTDITIDLVWEYRQHINLDDLDFGDDGIVPTLKRVIGDRGVGIWRVDRKCR
jgi:GPI mannosyltransferase 4